LNTLSGIYVHAKVLKSVIAYRNELSVDSVFLFPSGQNLRKKQSTGVSF